LHASRHPREAVVTDPVPDIPRLRKTIAEEIAARVGERL
jgi:hypothetical protein